MSGRTGGEPVSGVARCRECGYALAGLDPGAGAVAARCPECGERFDPLERWRPEAMPSGGALLAELVLPAVVVCAALAGVWAVPGLRNVAVWPWWLVWLGLVVFFALVWPWVRMSQLARERVPARERGGVVRRAAMVASAVNLGAVVAAGGVMWVVW